MSPQRVGQAALLFAFALAGCGGAEVAQSGSGTDETTETLLRSGPGTSAMGGATELPSVGLPDGPISPDQRIPIAPLGRNYGSDTAIVQVLEMSDFGCGYCRQFHQQTWPVVLDEFVDTEMVQWKFVPFVTGMFANSREVTEVAECTLQQSPELFSAVGDRLWRDQSDWKGSADPAGLARGWAEEAGVDLDRLDACLDDGSGLQRVATSTALSRQLRVRGTPTFFVVGYAPIQGALPTELFRELLSAAHSMAEGEPGGQ